MLFALLLALLQLPQAPKHLTFTATASAATAAPGSTIQLWLDITPKHD